MFLSILKDTRANYKKPVKVADSLCVSDILQKAIIIIIIIVS